MFSEQLLVYGETSADEMLDIVTKMNRVGQLLIDAGFKRDTLGHQRHHTNSPGTDGLTMAIVRQLSIQKFHKICLAYFRCLALALEVTDRVTYYDSLRIFEGGYQKSSYRQMASSLKAGYISISSLKSSKTKKSQAHTGDTEPHVGLLSPVITKLMIAVRSKALQIGLELAGLALDPQVGEGPFGGQPKLGHAICPYPSKLRASPQATPKAINQLNALLRTEAATEYINSQQLNFAVTPDLKTESDLSDTHYVAFIGKDVKTSGSKAKIRTLFGQLLAKTTRFTQAALWLQKTKLFFGLKQTQFIKAFGCDPQAFEHQILDFERLKFQIKQLQSLMSDREAQDALQTYRAETERVFHKIITLFDQCQDQNATIKLQSVLSHSNFYHPVLDFVTQFGSPQMAKGVQESASMCRLVRLMIRLLELFAKGNPHTQTFSVRYIPSLIDFMEKGHDVAYLINLFLEPLKNSEFEFFVAYSYERVLQNLNRQCVKKLSDLVSHASFKTAEGNLKAFMSAKRISHHIRSTTVVRKLTRSLFPENEE